MVTFSMRGDHEISIFKSSTFVGFLISFNDLSYGDCWRLNSINQLRPINGRLEASTRRRTSCDPRAVARGIQKYQNFPEYQKVNNGMSLEDFKYIFYWEYGHRVLGRLIGMVFFFPFTFFYLTGRVRGRYAFKLLIAFILGGAQGLLGWYMVKSGLVNEPHVSHYRLAAHLSLALICLAYLFVLSSEIWPQTWLSKSRFSLPKLSVGIAACVFLRSYLVPSLQAYMLVSCTIPFPT